MSIILFWAKLVNFVLFKNYIQLFIQSINHILMKEISRTNKHRIHQF